MKETEVQQFYRIVGFLSYHRDRQRDGVVADERKDNACATGWTNTHHHVHSPLTINICKVNTQSSELLWNE